MSDKDDISVRLLIGANCTKVLEPIDNVLSEAYGPCTFETKLGWLTTGPVDGINKE